MKGFVMVIWVWRKNYIIKLFIRVGGKYNKFTHCLGFHYKEITVLLILIVVHTEILLPVSFYYTSLCVIYWPLQVHQFYEPVLYINT